MTTHRPDTPLPAPPRPDRRRVLKALGGAAGLTVGNLLAACRPAESPPPGVRVELSAIPEGGRLRALIGDYPIEIRRTAGGGVAARSLLCTHFGCEVRWHEERGTYDCPCHDGRFDANGRVLLGPPPAPLRDLPVEMETGAVTVRLPASET